MTRCFVSCFNITPEFFNGFVFPKSKGGGVFGIKYMEAVFNKEAESGEIFIEFDEYVWEHKLIECFEAQGAGQVTTITFAHNDGGDSAANALVRILLAQEKHGGYSRGACPAALHAKTMAKRTEAKQKLQTVSRQEFDEKTAAAIKLSLDHIETGVQSQAVKLEGIHNGVCYVIPDYQNEIAKLKDTLTKKTAACDTIEGRLAYKTRVVNQQDKYIAELEEDRRVLVEQKQTLIQEKINLFNENTTLKEQLDLSRHLKQILEKTQHTAEILSSTLAEERASKRQRREEGSHFAIQ
jgi:hypothetical protein